MLARVGLISGGGVCQNRPGAPDRGRHRASRTGTGGTTEEEVVALTVAYHTVLTRRLACEDGSDANEN